MYVYIQTKPYLWSVGFFDPEGKFRSESEHDHSERAAQRVAWLNGEKIPTFSEEKMTISELIETIETKLWDEKNKLMLARIRNLLLEMSKSLIYVDQISEKFFCDFRNAGTISWKFYLDLLPKARTVQNKFLVKSKNSF